MHPWSQPGGPQSDQHRRCFLRTASQIGFFAVVVGAEVATGATFVFADAVVVGANVVVAGAVVETTAAVVTQSFTWVVVGAE